MMATTTTAATLSALLLLSMIHPLLSQSNSKPMIFSLKTQNLPPSLPRPPNKLRFHHNVSLTVTLSVGTPPQNVSMVLDTGSELSWLMCNINSSTSSFNSSSSSSFRPIPCSSPTCTNQTRDLPNPAFCDNSRCSVSVSYADGSSSDGSLSSDLFRLGDAQLAAAAFGCMSSSTDPSTTGILGMNRGALSFISQTSTPSFSYCISDRDSSGLLLIGRYNDPNYINIVPPLNYTPFTRTSLPLPYFDRVAYSVQLDGIKIGGALLPIPRSVLVPDHTGAGQTMVDSGTQFTFLLGPAYDILKTEFLKQTRGILTPVKDPDFVFEGAFDTCFEGVGLVDARVPEVSLVFRGAEVRVRRERLLYRVDSGGGGGGGEGRWCLTFGNSDLAGIEAYVIGHHHQMNVWVEYDLVNGRVGFGPVQCDLASQKLGLTL